MGESGHVRGHLSRGDREQKKDLGVGALRVRDRGRRP